MIGEGNGSATREEYISKSPLNGEKLSPSTLGFRLGKTGSNLDKSLLELELGS